MVLQEHYAMGGRTTDSLYMYMYGCVVCRQSRSMWYITLETVTAAIENPITAATCSDVTCVRVSAMMTWLSYVPVWWAGWRCRFRSSLRSAAATDDCSPCRAPPAHTSCRQSPSWWRSNVTWLDVVSVHWVNRKVFDAKSTIRSTQSHNSSEMSPESYNTCLSVSSVFQFPLFIFPISDRFICVCNVLQSHTGCKVYTKPLFTTTWLLCKH